MSNNLYPVFAYGKWGAVDQKGNQVIPIIYTYSRITIRTLPIFTIQDNFVIVIKNNKLGVLDMDSYQEILSTIYADIQCYDGKLWCVLRDKIWYMWRENSLYQIGEYDSVSFINEEFIQLEKYVECEFDYKKAENLNYVYSIAENKIFLKSEVHIFYNDLAVVCINGKYGFINRTQELVIPAIYDYANNFDNGFAYVKIGEFEYYIDTLGLQVISSPFYRINYFDKNCHSDAMFMEGIWDGLVCYEENGFVGLKGLYNQIITSPIYDCIYLAHQEVVKYIAVRKNRKQGIIDKDGNCIIPCEYDLISYHSITNIDLFIINNYRQEGGRCRCKCGIVDINNKSIIPPIYSDIQIIQNNLALIIIRDENKYGVMDIFSQELVIPLIYDEFYLCGDLFFVEKDNKWGYIDLQGNEVLKIEQDFDYSIYRDYCYFKTGNERWGWVNEIDMSPDLSKCNNEKEVYFKDWKPIVKEKSPSSFL